MSHNLVSAIPGQPGGFKSGKVGEYTCACGEVLPGNESYKAHRSEALRTEAINRAARALKEAIRSESVGWYWDDYIDVATQVLDAAKVRKVR